MSVSDPDKLVSIEVKDFRGASPEEGVVGKLSRPVGRIAMRYLADRNPSAYDAWKQHDGELLSGIIVREPRFYSDLARFKHMAIFNGYVDGTWEPHVSGTYLEEAERTSHPESDALVVVLRNLLRKIEPASKIADGLGRLMADYNDGRALLSMPTADASEDAVVAQALEERNRMEIADHYDKGNDLYTGEFGFLDQTYHQYSSGLLDTTLAPEQQDLDQMQKNKIEELLRMLEITDDCEQILEIGTGWGGLAQAILESADHINLTSLTLSAEQHEFASERMKSVGMDDRANILLKHYREQARDPQNRHRFDRLISVEMIEAVDWPYLQDYVDSCCELVKSDGKVVLQAIMSTDGHYDRYKHKPSFINQSIFPGGCLHSQAAITETFAKNGFNLQQETDLTESYPYTLRIWRDKFNSNFPEIRTRLIEQGEDPEVLDAFQRAWNMYLASAEAGFMERYILDKQLVFVKN